MLKPHASTGIANDADIKTALIRDNAFTFFESAQSEGYRENAHDGRFCVSNYAGNQMHQMATVGGYPSSGRSFYRLRHSLGFRD